LGESELGAVPPVVAVMLVERLEDGELVELAADLAGEADQAEHAGRRRERHGIARPAFHVLADRLERGRRLAGQDLLEGRDLAFFARRRVRSELERPSERRLGLVAAAQELLGAGERDMGEREALIGSDGLGEVGIHAGGRRHQAVHAGLVGVARRRRGRAEFVAVAILQHLFHSSLPAVASHIGAAIDSAKLLNIRLNEMLMRSVWPWLDGTLCFSQAGKISRRPSLLSALAELAVSREYCRGLGM